jgi:hypothetical protein
MNQKSNVSSGTSTASGSAQLGSHGHDPALDMKDSVAEGVRDLGNEVKHIAGDVAGEARKTAEIQLAGGKSRAAKGLGSVAQALHTTSAHLREQEKGELADYVVRAANQVEAASSYLAARTIGQIVADVERFARREPALFLGGTFAIGLVGGRFLKSSRPERVPDGHDSGARSDQGRSSRRPFALEQGHGRHGEDSTDSPRHVSSSPVQSSPSVSSSPTKPSSLSQSPYASQGSRVAGGESASPQRPAAPPSNGNGPSPSDAAKARGGAGAKTPGAL